MRDIPLVYRAITDPVEAGLIKEKTQPCENMTGSSERQDLVSLLGFVKKLLPNAQKIGLLYATAESNDAALLKMMQEAATSMKMSVVAIPVDQARDVPVKMQAFKRQVDGLYGGTSGPIQPPLPAIAQ